MEPEVSVDIVIDSINENGFSGRVDESSQTISTSPPNNLAPIPNMLLNFREFINSIQPMRRNPGLKEFMLEIVNFNPEEDEIKFTLKYDIPIFHHFYKHKTLFAQIFNIFYYHDIPTLFAYFNKKTRKERIEFYINNDVAIDFYSKHPVWLTNELFLQSINDTNVEITEENEDLLLSKVNGDEKPPLRERIVIPANEVIINHIISCYNIIMLELYETSLHLKLQAISVANPWINKFLSLSVNKELKTVKFLTKTVKQKSIQFTSNFNINLMINNCLVIDHNLTYNNLFKCGLTYYKPVIVDNAYYMCNNYPLNEYNTLQEGYLLNYIKYNEDPDNHYKEDSPGHNLKINQMQMPANVDSIDCPTENITKIYPILINLLYDTFVPTDEMSPDSVALTIVLLSRLTCVLNIKLPDFEAINRQMAEIKKSDAKSDDNSDVDSANQIPPPPLTSVQKIKLICDTLANFIMFYNKNSNLLKLIIDVMIYHYIRLFTQQNHENLKDIKIPLSAEIRAKLEHTNYNVAQDGKTYDLTSCIICLNEFKDGSKITKLPCGHYYCWHCIDKWFDDSVVCPLCKKDIREYYKLD